MEGNEIMALAENPKHLGEAGAKAILNLIKNKAGINYGICENTATTSEKIVNVTGFELKEGAHVTVKFANGNVINVFTLNINNTGAKNVVSLSGGQIPKGEVCEFVYTSGNYIMFTTHNAVYRVTKTLNTPGWYRVAVLAANTGSAILQIDRHWNVGSNPKSDILTVAGGYRTVAFTQIGGYGTGDGIDKVRLVADNKSTNAYIEIHYTRNDANTVGVSIYPSNAEVFYMGTIDFTPGEVPNGYTSEEFTLSKYKGGMKASTFEGNLIGIATKAEQDAGGRIISETYERKPIVIFEGHVKTSYTNNFTLDIPSGHIYPLPYSCGGCCGGGNDWFEQTVSSGSYVRVRVLGVIDDMDVMFGEVVLFNTVNGSFSSDVLKGKIQSDIPAGDGEYGIVEIGLSGSQLSIKKLAGRSVDIFRVEIF